MPQATHELRARWDEASAWEQLAFKVIDHSGYLTFAKGVEPSDDDWSAVDYLCQEWDYSYGNKHSNVKVTGLPQCADGSDTNAADFGRSS